MPKMTLPLTPSPLRFSGIGFIHQLLWLGCLLSAVTVSQLGAYGQTMKAPDITTTPTLYVVPYAHLDTQWRWGFSQTNIGYLLKNMRGNFHLNHRYPHNVFNLYRAN